MADRVHPAKPTTNGTTTANGTTANPAFPATKAQLYGATRPAYRPQPNRKHRSRRSCFCCCCLWTTIVILSIIFLLAIAGTFLYLLYRPHRPSFHISALKISSLNLTSASLLTTDINFNLTTTNPNKKLVYTYNPITISVSSDLDDILLGTGTLPPFVHGTKNTTFLKASITSKGQPELDDKSAGKLNSELKSKNGVVGLKIKMDTKVKVKFGGLKSPNVRIRVSCDGIKGAAPISGKTTPTAGSVSNAKCKVDWRFKIWKWTF